MMCIIWADEDHICDDLIKGRIWSGALKENKPVQQWQIFQYREWQPNRKKRDPKGSTTWRERHVSLWCLVKWWRLSIKMIRIVSISPSCCCSRTFCRFCFLKKDLVLYACQNLFRGRVIRLCVSIIWYHHQIPESHTSWNRSWFSIPPIATLEDRAVVSVCQLTGHNFDLRYLTRMSPFLARLEQNVSVHMSLFRFYIGFARFLLRLCRDTLQRHRPLSHIRSCAYTIINMLQLCRIWDGMLYRRASQTRWYRWSNGYILLPLYLSLANCQLWGWPIAAEKTSTNQLFLCGIKEWSCTSLIFITQHPWSDL